MSTAAKEGEASSWPSGPMRRPPLHAFRRSFSHSWINQLSPEDPENLERSISLSSRGGGDYRTRDGARRMGAGGHPGRPVFNGHYVSVRPTPLKNPRLVIHSPDLLKELGFHEDEAQTEQFAKYFSGDVDGAFSLADFDDEEDAGAGKGKAVEKQIETWATPYALSIMGRRQTNNCPYGTGDGYGDGRAISVAEILVADACGGGADVEKLYPDRARRYELQLKGAGQTPFCRGADGRAVLRSSIREYLASEAMHALGISTTRALSLVTSEGPGGHTSTRPWYSGANRARELPKMDDPRLARFTDAQKREIISLLSTQMKSDPDMLVKERCAITTRVATSFVRIGHLDLFARRVDKLGTKPSKGTREYRELEDMMWHACYREFYKEAYEPHWSPNEEERDAAGAVMALMEGAMNGIAEMVGGWIRVGFVQGNFNADNCLAGGRTMDYGPFGFLDVYHPLSAKWVGSGEHFGFMNQPSAGYANFSILVESLMPIIRAGGGNADEVQKEILGRAKGVFLEAVGKAMRSKMGLDSGGGDLWGEIEPLLKTARGDWTLFWRQLTYVAEKYPPAEDGSDCGNYDGMVDVLLGEGDTNPFYDPLMDGDRADLRAWIENWHRALTKEYVRVTANPADGVEPPGSRMRRANPKYVPREWMLVEAYNKADPGKPHGSPLASPGGDYSGVHELFGLFLDPYGEGTPEQHRKYYRRTPDESLRAGGTAFMS